MTPQGSVMAIDDEFLSWFDAELLRLKDAAVKACNDGRRARALHQQAGKLCDSVTNTSGSPIVHQRGKILLPGWREWFVSSRQVAWAAIAHATQLIGQDGFQRLYEAVCAIVTFVMDFDQPAKRKGLMNDVDAKLGAYLFRR